MSNAEFIKRATAAVVDYSTAMLMSPTTSS